MAYSQNLSVGVVRAAIALFGANVFHIASAVHLWFFGALRFPSVGPGTPPSGNSGSRGPRAKSENNSLACALETLHSPESTDEFEQPK